ncbi:AI-2E family transporter [Candidatus Saccharibacteria bacterium]|nr:AI-2E family transporter [Candidatus Saccharibacteria bacterium]
MNKELLSMHNLRVNESQKKALAIATALAIVIGVFFLKNYLMLIILSAVVVVLFNPVYKWLIRKGSKPSSAATLTTFVSLLAVIIPFLIVGALSLFQIDKLVSNISAGNYSFNSETVSEIIYTTNDKLSEAGVTYRVSTEGIAEAISNAAEQFGKILLEGLLSSVTGFFALLTAAIIYLYVFISMLINQKKIIEIAKKLNPLGEQISDLYISRIGAMTKATVRGQLIIALCQGLASAAVLSFAGLSDLFFFFAVLLTVLSVIPLGAGIITIPIGVVMILMGNFWQGILVIANHILIVTNIDNILRPRLVPKEAKLDPALMILAVFSGLALFGFIGIIIGPVLMIVLVTTVQVYLEVFKDTKALNTSPEKKPEKLIKKISSWIKDKTS